MAFTARGSRSRAALVAASAAAAALLTAAAASPALTQPQRSSGLPDPDEVVTSGNVEHLANLPKQGPFANTSAYGTDIAFTDDHAIVGNYDGFVIYDIRTPAKPRIVSQVYCPGGQGDVSVYGDLLFVSTDYPRSNDTCTSSPTSASDPDAWEGIKIFDISDLSEPRYVAAVQTKCGSHTHTLVPDRAGKAVYLYVSSYGPSQAFPNCQPPHDKISIVKVPLDRPSSASVVAEPVLFPDGGNPEATTGCHDITAYPEKDLAAGACMGDGILLDISNRERPRVIEVVRDQNFAFWHSAVFNNDGTKVVFSDELGGGSAATCNAEIGPNRGANAIYDITGKGGNRELEFRSYFKISRHQDDTENCVAHNGALIPVKGRDIMVQAWYQGGVSIWEFTDSDNPREIGYFERGPLPPVDGKTLIGGSWSAYYYNGYIYSSDIQKGLDVLEIDDPRVNPAKQIRMDELNPQTQTRY